MDTEDSLLYSETDETKKKVLLTFGHHDYFDNLPDALNKDAFLRQLRIPTGNWSPEVVNTVNQLGIDKALCIDGLGSINVSNNSEQEKIYSRFLLISVLPFINPAKNEIDVILADPLLEQYAIDVEVAHNLYRNASVGEIWTTNIKDFGRQVILTSAIATLTQATIRSLYQKHEESRKSKLLSRRNFLHLSAIVSGSISTFAISRVISRSLIPEGFTLGENTDQGIKKLADILAPHFDIRTLTDGRTALMYAACESYSRLRDKTSHLLLGKEHVHFSDQIISIYSERVKKIKGLYLQYQELISNIFDATSTPITKTEIEEIARQLISEIKIATIKKPYLEEEINECFDHPQKYALIHSEKLFVPEVNEALL